jgi:hypothetical protein
MVVAYIEALSERPWLPACFLTRPTEIDVSSIQEPCFYLYHRSKLWIQIVQSLDVYSETDWNKIVIVNDLGGAKLHKGTAGGTFAANASFVLNFFSHFMPCSAVPFQPWKAAQPVEKFILIINNSAHELAFVYAWSIPKLGLLKIFHPSTVQKKTSTPTIWIESGQAMKPLNVLHERVWRWHEAEWRWNKWQSSGEQLKKAWLGAAAQGYLITVTAAMTTWSSPHRHSSSPFACFTPLSSPTDAHSHCLPASLPMVVFDPHRN